MNIIKKYRDRKIFRNMFIVSFGISLVSLAFAFAFGFIWFQGNTVDRAIENEEHELSNCMITIDNYITSAVNTLSLLNKNVYIQRLILTEDTRWNDQMSIVTNQIINTIAANPRLHSIMVFGEDKLLFKSSNATYPILTEQEQDLNTYFHTLTIRAYNLYTYTDVYKKDQQLLSITSGEISKNERIYVNGVMVNLDIWAIINDVFPDIISNENYILLDSEFNVIGVKGDDYHFDTSATDDFCVLKLKEQNESEGSFIVVDDRGTKFLVNYISNHRNNYYLLHVLPYDLILSPIKQTMTIVTLIGLGILFIIFTISFLLSTWVYNPIDKVVNETNVFKNLKSGNTIGSSTQNELSPVTQYIHTMVSQLNQYKEKNEESDLIHYLNSFYKNEKIPESLIEWSDESALTNHQAICFRICDVENFVTSNSPEAIKFQFQTIENIVTSTLSDFGEILTVVMDNEYMAILILSIESESTIELLRNKTAYILQLVNDMLSLKMDAGISERRHKLFELKQAYQSAKAATKYSFLYGMNSIISEDQMQSFAFKGPFDYDFQLIMHCIKNNDTDEFLIQFHQMLSALKGYSLQCTYEALIALAIEMTKYLKNISSFVQDINIADFENLRKEIMAFRYVDEAMTWYIDLLSKIQLALSSRATRGSMDIVTQALQYLDENYMDPNLSAQLIADKFSITPSYFSRIFNEYCKTAFPDYLTTLRMEHAKEMLIAHPSKSIQDICTIIGYTSSSYFTALFKKKYGITPSQFRKGHLEP